MNIFVAGGGRVGVHLVRLLSLEKHSVTVIEIDPNMVEQIDTSLDVRTVKGNAASVALLQELDAGKADLFVAVTGEDELNLIAASMAKGLGARQAVARVHEPTYIESNILYENLLALDFLLSPEALTALAIARYIESPGIAATQEFAGGLVQMRQIRVARSSTTGGKTLKDVCPPGMGVLLAAISRNGAVTIPHGDSVVEPGDLVTLIGKRESMKALQKLFQGVEPTTASVAVMGGGSIGLHLALALEPLPIRVKLFETDLRRCQELAERLPKVKVVNRDATRRSSLEEEDLQNSDVFIAATGDDENNIMASVLAKEVGAPRTIAVVHDPDFAPLVSRLGIDHAVTPRAAIANRILQLIHRTQVSTIAVLEEGQVEILELKVSEHAPIVGKTLRESREKFPDGVLVATILRGSDVIVPSGEDIIYGGDSVVLVASLDSLEAVQRLFLR